MENIDILMAGTNKLLGDRMNTITLEVDMGIMGRPTIEAGFRADEEGISLLYVDLTRTFSAPNRKPFKFKSDITNVMSDELEQYIIDAIREESKC